MARTQQAAQANITLQEQIEAIHKAKGLVQEDETKDKIGPSKPNETAVPPPLPTTVLTLPKPSPPISTIPRAPPAAVSGLVVICCTLLSIQGRVQTQRCWFG